jgi:ATP diphosphatase
LRWDIAQTFATIAPYTIEEAYEVADAIARRDMPALVDELGDLQLQVVFQATIAEQAGLFTLADVLASICDKLERRHPHIFGDGPTPGWEELKAIERTTLADSSALAGVPVGAPALMRAQKLQARAARVGFDWPDAAGARDKVVEELAEVDAAASEHQRRDEVGDLLFAAVNLARKHGVDAEDALRQASRKFEARFRWMEAAEPGLASKSLDEQEALWQRAKAALRSV